MSARAIVYGALAFPVVAYLAFVALFGVNVPYYDDFGKVAMVDHLATGHLTLQDLWQQQNEHRLFLTMLLVELPLALATRWNLHATMFASAFLLILASVILIRTWTATPLRWAAVPVVALLFTTVQYANTLLAWTNVYLGLVGFVAVCAMLEAGDRKPLVFWAALATAVATSFTEFQGLFVWGAALPYLAGRGRIQIISWCLAAAAAMATYFAGFQISESSATLPHFTAGTLLSPTTLIYPLVQLGGLVAGATLPDARAIAIAAIAGCVLAGFIIAAGTVVVRGGWRSKEFRLPLALALFGGFHVALNYVGRSNLRIDFAASSRYATYTVLLLVAAYMVLERQASREPSPRRSALYIAFCVAIAVQFVSSTAVSWPAGAISASERHQGADVIVNYRMASDEIIERYLWCCPVPVRAAATLLERDSYSVFASPVASDYRAIGIVPAALEPQMLPGPDAISADLARDPVARLGWSALSGAYEDDGQLQDAFPGETAATGAAMLHWATRNGLADPKTQLYLRPFTDLYRELDERVRRAHGAPPESGNILNSDAVEGSEWSAAAPFSYDGTQREISIAPGNVDVASYASSPELIVAPLERYRFSSLVDARGLVHGRTCFYAANMPLGEALGMACVVPGTKRTYSFDVTMPSWMIGVRWAVLADAGAAFRAPVRFDAIRIERVGSPGSVPQSTFENAGIDDAAGRAQWFLPEGASIDSGARRVDVRSTGPGPSAVYVSSEMLPVLPGWSYTISATVDARHASKADPCFYLAENPSGLGVAMTCVRAGSKQHREATVTIPYNVWLAQWVAFTNGTTIAPNAPVSYSDIHVRLAGGPFAQPL